MRYDERNSKYAGKFILNSRLCILETGFSVNYNGVK